MTKVLYEDCETTGIDPKLNGLIQYACIIEVDGKVEAERSWNIKPFETDIIEDEALRVNGKTREQLASFMEPRKAQFEIEEFWGQHVDRFKKFKTPADKFTVAGFKVDFDTDVMANFWRKCNNVYIGSFFNGKKLDPLPILHVMDHKGLISLPDYKLVTACNYFGIDTGNAHDAMADIRMTKGLIKILLDNFKMEVPLKR